MSGRGWVAVLAATVLAEIVIAGVLFRMALEENCNNNVSRWQCSESLEGALIVVLLALPAAVILTVAIARARARLRR